MFPFSKVLKRFEEWPSVEARGFGAYYFPILIRGVIMWIGIVAIFVGFAALLMTCPWFRSLEATFSGPVYGLLFHFDINAVFKIIIIGSVIGLILASAVSLWMWFRCKKLHSQGAVVWYDKHPGRKFYEMGKSRMRYGVTCVIGMILSVLFSSYLINGFYFETVTIFVYLMITYLFFGFVMGFVLSIPQWKALERAFKGGAVQKSTVGYGEDNSGGSL